MGKGGRVVSERGVVDLVDEDTEKGGSLVIWIRLELGIDLYDEGGSHCGEQTGL